MRELVIEKSKTIQIPVIIGTVEDLKEKGFTPDEVYAPITIKNMVLGGGYFYDNYPKAIFINTEELKDLQEAEFSGLIAYSMRFALENSTNLYGYIINHLYELCDLDAETLEELFEAIYKVHDRILRNKTKEERQKISVLEALGDFFLSLDAFPESDCVAFGCIAGANYSYRSELLQTEDFYEIRDMFVPFGLSISQTKYDNKELYKLATEYLKGRDDSDRMVILKKIGKAVDLFDVNSVFFNEVLFESVYFNESSGE